MPGVYLIKSIISIWFQLWTKQRLKAKKKKKETKTKAKKNQQKKFVITQTRDTRLVETRGN